MTDRNIDIIAVAGSSEARKYYALERKIDEAIADIRAPKTEQVDEMAGFPTDPEAIAAIPDVDNETLPLALHG